MAALHVYLRTGTSKQAAQSPASEFLAHAYAMEGGPLMRYAIAGEPQECAERLSEYIDAGVEHFVLRPAAWEQRGQLDDWAEHLLPLLPPLRGSAPTTPRSGGMKPGG
jgi:alkanesulfonate monooxygenase SsuD/methylene tetrahydromethanopterin reductase-like flavin-dependent oxidoreductase (luciferase family)